MVTLGFLHLLAKKMHGQNNNNNNNNNNNLICNVALLGAVCHRLILTTRIPVSQATEQSLFQLYFPCLLFIFSISCWMDSLVTEWLIFLWSATSHPHSVRGNIFVKIKLVTLFSFPVPLSRTRLLSRITYTSCTVNFRTNNGRGNRERDYKLNNYFTYRVWQVFWLMAQPIPCENVRYV